MKAVLFALYIVNINGGMERVVELPSSLMSKELCMEKAKAANEHTPNVISYHCLPLKFERIE